VSIARGTTISAIASLLQSKRLIEDRRVFLVYVWRHKMASRLQAGDYRLNTAMSVAEIAKALQEGRFEFKTTFPEGWTLAQTAEKLARVHLLPNAQELLGLKEDPELLQLAKTNTGTIEGFLFPDTYFFERGMSARQIARRMIETFNSQARDALSSPTLALGHALTRDELVTLASMIEREARTTREMPLMSSVYYNRMKKDMRLQCDATVRYAMNEWSRDLLYKDLQFDSPYNTYRHKGLPPAPICNPSLQALSAAAHPHSSEYLFYVYKGNNEHVYTKTFKEHEDAIAKYMRKAAKPNSK